MRAIQSEGPTASLSHLLRRDRVRTAVLAGSCAAFVGVLTLLPLFGVGGEDADHLDTEITPPGYAFAVWAPIFLANAANAAHGLAHPADEVHRRSDWWVSAAYLGNAVWSVLAQFAGFRGTDVVLPASAACAAMGHRRVQVVQIDGASRITPAAIAALLGWTSVASVVNVFALRDQGPLSRHTPTGRAAARIAVLLAAVPLGAAVATSWHGGVAIATTSGWAFGTSALDPRRRLITRVATGIAAGVVCAAALVRRRRTASAR